jgi:hypothetical protein
MQRLAAHARRRKPQAASRKSQSGQAAFETAILFSVVLVPLTFGLLVVAELAWTYHSLVTLTRQGARYAATHCWQDSVGSNVTQWMVANCPPFVDRKQLSNGGAQIQVQYWQTDLTDPTNPVTTAFAGNCDACTSGCQPDSVTVGISGYRFSSLVTLLGMQPIQVPGFATTVEMQSMGGNPDIGVSSP